MNRKAQKERDLNILKEYTDGILSKKEIQLKYKVSPQMFYLILKKFNIQNIRKEYKYKIDNTVFEKIDTQEKAYFLGLYMSDGSVMRNHRHKNKRITGINISLMDEDIILKLKSFLKTDAPIVEYQNPGKSKMFRLTICSHKIATDAEKWGLIPNKTYRTLIPKISNNLIKHFIRGYFDGDGCLYSRKNKNCRTCLITSSSLKILEQIEEYCKQNDIIRKNKKIYVQKYRKYNCWDFRLDHRYEIYKFLKHIYENATVFMDRKYKYWLSIKDIPLMTKKNYAVSKYFGVGFHPENKLNPFHADFGFNGIQYNLGGYHTELEAAKAYNNKIIELGLPETMLNKIEDEKELIPPVSEHPIIQT